MAEEKKEKFLEYEGICLECVQKTWEGKSYNAMVFLCDDGGVRNLSSNTVVVSPMDITQWSDILKGDLKVGKIVLEAYLFKGKTALRLGSFRLN